MQNYNAVQELEQERKEAEEAAKKAKSNTVLGWFGKGDNDQEGSFELSFAGLFKCMLCTHDKPIDEKAQLLRIADNLGEINKRLDGLERYVY